MTYSSFWFGKESDTPLPPAPSGIGNSLRFRGGGDTSANTAGEYLQGSTPSPSGDFTYSLWWKRGSLIAGAPDSVPMTFLSFADNQCYQLRLDKLIVRNGGSAPNLSDGNVIDPTAWYHCVWQSSGGNTTLFINGVQQSNPQATPIGSQNMIIGSNTNAGDNKFIGYMADANLIDGQALPPTAFGKYDDNNLWVPIEYEGNYGNNGFHLTFAPDTITQSETGATITVADVSGLGNNFTGYGFDLVQITAPAGRYSSGLTVVGGWQAAGVAGATEAFNGLERPGANSIDIGAEATWAPNPPVQFEKSFEVLGVSQDWSWNGTTGTMGTTFQYYTIATGSGEISTTTPFVFGNGTSATNMQAVRIDGVVLAEGVPGGYDLMVDSPTQNYATMSPLFPYTSFNLQDGNLLCDYPDALNQQRGFSTMALGTADAYFELTPLIMSEGVQLGIATQEAFDDITNSSSNSFTVDQGGNIRVNGTVSNTNNPSFVVNQTVGFTWDGSTGTFSYTVDGTNYTYIAINAAREQFVMVRIGNTSQVACNFGQQPFIYTPPSRWASARLQTQTLPTLDVTDGFDGFRPVQAPGAGILPVAQGKVNGANGATGFTSGLYWIKDYQNPNQWQFVSSITGDEAYLSPQGTTATYTPPSGTSIAYCWDTDETYTGAGVTSGRRNTTTGFSMCTYTGDGNATQSIAHGLGAVPAWTCVFNRAANEGYPVFQNGMTAGDTITLDAPRAAGSYPTYSAFSSTEVTVEGTFNDSGENFMMWNFVEVPGYSAMGRYEGTANADGPFIYTGFTPSFVLIKNTGQEINWYVYDSTRPPNNSTKQILSPNTDQIQNNDSNNINFLANGFQIVSSDSATNGGSKTMVYMAFASNPFGGSNVEPGNAALTLPHIPGVADLNSDGNSLRFKPTATNAAAYLYNTELVGTVTGSYTISVWAKKSNFPAGARYILTSGSSGNNASSLSYDYDSASPAFLFREGGGIANPHANGIEHVDQSAWYHVVCTQDIVSGQQKIYINGDLQATANGSAGDTIFSESPVQIGLYATPQDYVSTMWEGYLSDMYFVDGQVLSPTDFGRYDDNGAWIPRTSEEAFEKIGGTSGFGSSGFFLEFAPHNVALDGNDILMKDLSGNGNDFIMDGFNVFDPTSPTFDLVVDGPGQNFPTLNPLWPNTEETIFAGNLAVTTAQLTGAQASTRFPVGMTGKYYVEASSFNTNSSACAITLTSEVDADILPDTGVFTTANYSSIGGMGTSYSDFTSTTASSYTAAVVPYYYVALGIDFDNQKVYQYANGVLVNTDNTVDFTKELAINIQQPRTAYNTYQPYINFGQLPFFGTIPEGFTTMEADNLPAVTVEDGSDGFRAVEAPGGAILPVAQGLNNDMYGSTGFTSGLWWIKDTQNANQWQFVSTLIGGTYGDWAALADPTNEYAPYNQGGINALFDGSTSTRVGVLGNSSNNHVIVNFTSQNVTFTQLQMWFSADSAAPTSGMVFINGVDVTGNITSPPNNDSSQGAVYDVTSWITGNTLQTLELRNNGGNRTYQVYAIDVDGDRLTQDGYAQALNCPATSTGLIPYVAPSGTSVGYTWDTNSSGLNTTTGFQIIEYQGDNSTSARQIPHNLGAVPKCIIVKCIRTSSYQVYNIGTDETNPENYVMWLDVNNERQELTVWGNTAPTSTNFTVQYDGTNVRTNGPTTDDFVAWVWAEVPGYSAMGSYTGNGTTGDGPFIYTGFTPAFVMIKMANGAYDWLVGDSTTSPHNPISQFLDVNLTAGLGTNEDSISMLSNGFKVVTNSAAFNASGGQYTYLAFASVPFGGSNVNEAPAALNRPQATPVAPGPLQTVSNSLRFSGKGHYLQRTQVAGSRTTFTYSIWFKKTNNGKNPANNAGWFELLGEAGEGSTRTDLRIEDDQLATYSMVSGNIQLNLKSEAYYLDPSAWNHLVWVFDTTQSESPERVKWYVNGQQQPITGSYPGPNTETQVGNAGQIFSIGDLSTFGESRNELNGYVAETYLIDGLAIEPSSFGGYDTNGNWVPREYNGSYGQNGFHLTFEDRTQIGKDYSGNGNDFTNHGFNFDLPATSEYDQMTDSPTQNFATLNPLNVDETQGQPVLSNANLQMTFPSSAASSSAYSTIEIPLNATVKYYIESFIVSSDNNASYPAMYFNKNSIDGANTESNLYFYQQNNGVIVFGDGRANAAGVTWTTGDTVGITIDPTADTVTLQVNGGTSNTVDLQSTAADKNIAFNINTSGGHTAAFNAGQQPFLYQPAGTETLSSGNLPAATITNGTEGFRPVLAPGNDVLSVAQADRDNPDGYTGFQGPAMWWIKDIQNSNQWQIMDSVRGASNALTCPAKGAQSSFNTPAGTSISYSWREDPTLGFDILTWTGDGVSGRTISHNLDQTKPLDWVIVRAYSAGSGATYINDANWVVWMNGMGADNIMYMNAPNGVGTADTMFSATGPNSVLGSLTVGSDPDTNANPATFGADYEYVGYVFQSVPGYSSFGIYNGSDSPNTPFVYTGFKPSFVMIKNENSGPWMIFDTSSNPYNLGGTGLNQLNTNTTTGFIQESLNTIDFMSNGFKIAGEGGNINGGAGKLYAAFASNPFGGSNVNPTNAALTPVPVVQYDEGNYEVGGSALTVGTAFTHNGIQYPANWRDILSHDYLTSIGATWVLS